MKHLARKSLVGMVPFVGGPGAELIGLLSSPVEQRRDEWFEDLHRRLRELEDKMAGFRFEDLAQNEQFVSAVLQATQAAVRTHQEEKIEALQNAVLNVAIGIDLSQDLRAIFLSFIDSFTPSHIHMLRFLQNRLAAPLEFNPRKERAFSDQLINDLNIRGLLKDGRPYAARGRDDNALVDDPWEVSAMGKQFLQFIAAP